MRTEGGNYFVLECWEDDESPPHVTLLDVPEFEDVSWISGFSIPRDKVPKPIKLAIEGGSGDVAPPILDEGIPLWRKDVIAGVTAAGVDNIETFDVELLDTRTNFVLTDYKAVNVVGLVAAADLDRSKHKVHGRPVVDVDFDTLVVDEHRAHDLRMFRLAECVTAVVIHLNVKNALDQVNGLSFVPPADWIG